MSNRRALLKEFIGAVFNDVLKGVGSDKYLPNLWTFGEVSYDTPILDMLEDIGIKPEDLSHYVAEKGDTLQTTQDFTIVLYRNGEKRKEYEDLEQLLWDVKFPAI